MDAWHGLLGDIAWPAPGLARTCAEEARSDYHGTKQAHEYLDLPDVLTAKVQILAGLLRTSRECVAYTGAGISTASGIGDYATKAQNSLACKGPKQWRKVMPMDAKPTLAHNMLAVLHHAGCVKHWVQQNHDGLPQKSGFPQEHLNEIHGSLFDPSNPVVPMGGTLRPDLSRWMDEWAVRADLCLALGTSLSGMAADCIASIPAQKAQHREEGALGTVIVALQQTPHDAGCSLRLFAPIDVVMEMLAAEMGFEAPSAPMPVVYATVPAAKQEQEHVYTGLPYAPDGRRDETASMTLDLRVGHIVRVIGQKDGDRQKWGDKGTVVESRGGTLDEGHYSILLGENPKTAILRVLGRWWLDAALKGAVPLLPVVPHQNDALP